MAGRPGRAATSTTRAASPARASRGAQRSSRAIRAASLRGPISGRRGAGGLVDQRTHAALGYTAPAARAKAVKTGRCPRPPLRPFRRRPVHDEEGAAPALAQEIAAAFEGVAHEIIFVDDASRDGTRAALPALKARLPQLRVLAHAQERRPEPGGAHRRAGGARPRSWSPSTATARTIRPTRPRLVAPAARPVRRALALVGGERVKRQDSAAKRCASRVGNGVRKRLLNDQADDTGCGLKAFRREAFLRLPYFDHMHRYLPALMLREGYEVAFEPVGHRPRTTGRVEVHQLGRLMVSVADLQGVLWLRRRARRPGTVERALSLPQEDAVAPVRERARWSRRARRSPVRRWPPQPILMRPVLIADVELDDHRAGSGEAALAPPRTIRSSIESTSIFR